MKYNLPRLFLWTSVLVVVYLTARIVCQSLGDWGNWLLTVAVLVLAAWTLDSTLLKPPSIWIETPDELGTEDIIYYIYENNGVMIPRDYLFQLHALIGNTGGKQAVITKVRVTGFKTIEGGSAYLSERAVDIGGHLYNTWISYSNAGNGANFDRRLDPPPYTLQPHDVLIVRFRYRGGIDWSNRWNLESLRSFYNRVSSAPELATIEITFRWGKNKKVVKKDVAIKVLQHDEYVSQLCSITDDFTNRPDVPEQQIRD